MENAIIIVFVGLLVFASHVFTGIFERKRIPDVLLLMLIGLLLGPIFGLITPSDFGIAGPMFTTITLVIILFEGGLALNIETIKQSIRGTTALTFTSFFVTVVVIGLIAWLAFGLSLVAGLMLGAIVGGTSSAVIIPMTQHLKIKDDSKAILVLESAINDVLCIVFALALLETFFVEEVKIGLVVGKIISSFILAAIMGWLGAMAWSFFLNKIRMIRNNMFTTPAFVFVIYGIAEILGFSGAISSLAFGITLANVDMFYIGFMKKHITNKSISLNETEKIFFSEIVFLLKTFFFVYIGLSIQLQNVLAMALGLLVTIVLFCLRIPVVRFSIRQAIPTFDMVMFSVMVPKGLAAAALASLPFQRGLEGGEFIRDITYAIILFSIIFSSLLVPAVEKYPRFRSFYGLFLRTGIVKRKQSKTPVPSDDGKVE